MAYVPKGNELNVLRALCTVAWADEVVEPQERDHILRLAGEWNLPEADVKQVEAWLGKKPEGELLDANTLSDQDREMILREAYAVTWQDGEYSKDEARVIGRLGMILKLPHTRVSELRKEVRKQFR